MVDAGEVGDYELLIVDDASTDDTGDLADKIAASDPRVRVVHHDRNRGLGGAVKTGLAQARGDVVLYTDADMPFDLAELAKACRLMRLYGADVVSAYRHDRTGEGLRRALYSFVYNWIVRILFGIKVRDVNFAGKLFHRRVLEHLELASDGSFIDAEMLVRAERLGFRVIQFGVDYFPRSRGVSTLSSTGTIVRIVGDMVRLRPELARVRPLGPAAVAEAVAAPEAVRRTGVARQPRRLVVNADDYGLTEAVSRGILRAHRDGVVTSTSVLAVAPGFARSGPWLADAPDLGVGVHLAAVGEDPPLLSAAEIPSLLDRRGRFPVSWRAFLWRVAAGAVDPDDVAREFAAQIERVQALGVPLTHLDTHQHLHLWPSVGAVVVDLAGRHGIGAVRVPRSAGGRPTGVGVNRLARGFARRASAAGLSYAGASAGFD
ncbi:MAG: ChbG/HpnK family deacetylase, partial [Acidimicrobiales bacterium]